METINLTVYKNPKSPIAEAFRTIRTNLQFAGVDKPLKTIVITSALPNEGKSTIAASLAIVMAQAGYKTLLIDCDLRNPTLHKVLGLTNKGLSNCLAGDGDYRQILQQTGVEHLQVITSGPVAPNPSELLGSRKMGKLLEEVSQDYDYVLLDTPPVMPVTDASVLGGKVDGVLLVVASEANPPSLERLAKTRLELAHAKILGCVLNKVKIAAHTYGYGHYGNSYGYGSYGYYYYGEDEDQGEGESHHHHKKVQSDSPKEQAK